MTPERAEKYLQRETGDEKLRVRWNNKIERFEVGRWVDAMSGHIEWFYTVTDGQSGYRPVDLRTVRKIISMDTWRRPKHLSVEDFVKGVEEKRLERDAERSEVIKYRLKHGARYVKKMAERDGIV